jgi:EmrB/QacA subfamily drug resistance transporter
VSKQGFAHKIIPFIIALSFFMEAVDSTVINTAIPAMSRSLHVPPVDLKVALISYLLSLAIFIPISGWLADKYGAKRIFIFALSIFTLSSIWCGFSQHLTELVMARFMQGLGGALGLPVGRLIIVRTFGREQFIRISGQVVMVGAIGMMLGPMIGGYITHYLSWQWIFWVNIPIGLFAIVLSYFFLQDTERLTVPPLDKVGFVFFGAALSGFTYGFAALSESRRNPFDVLIIFVLSLVLLIAYRLWSKRQAHPIVKFNLLHHRTFKIAVMGNLISRLGFGGIPFLIPLLLQIGLGYPAQESGLLLAPIALGVVLVRPFLMPLLRFLGYKKLLMLNTFVAGLSIWAFMLIHANTSIYLIGTLTFLYGFILSLQYGVMNSLAYADIASNDLSAATSMMSTIQQLSQSFGVAISALFIRFFSLMLFGKLTLTTTVFDYTFFAVGFFTMLSAFVFMKLKPCDGRQMMSF